MHCTRIDAILDYWFLPRHHPHHGTMQKKWFSGGAAVDEEIRRRFGHDLERALAGHYDGWTDTPRGALAYCVLLDQMTRNAFRGTGRAFAGDGRAFHAARCAIARGFDRRFPTGFRRFFYLPFEHREELNAQHRCIGLMSRVYPARSVRWAVQHREIVARFGRFPHRNAALGRDCTPDEEAYLATPHPRFGQ